MADQEPYPSQDPPSEHSASASDQPMPPDQAVPREPIAEGQVVVPQAQAAPPQGQAVVPQGQAVPPQGQVVVPPGQEPVPSGHVAPPPTQVAVPQTQPIVPEGQAVSVQEASQSPSLQEPDAEEEEEEELTSVALRKAPPWLVSAVVHMLIMIGLGLILFPKLAENDVDLESQWAEQLGDQLEFDSFLAGTAQDDTVEEPVFTSEDLPAASDPFAAPPEVDLIVPDGTSSTSDVKAAQVGVALSGREEGAKRALLGAYGGNALTAAAVQNGLRWLAKNQLKDGSWSLEGPYKNGAIAENSIAATAMALLAFQGDGNTHREGPFKSNVDKGWYWLIKEQDGNGSFFHEGPYNHRFYTNGQCTIALCELLGMSRDEQFREPAELAVAYLLEAQSSEGGWKYSFQGNSDVSVTGWILMALQSARMAGIDVPKDNLRRVERFLDKLGTNGGTRYPYERGKEASLAMTAEALLCRQYLGWNRNDPRLIDGVKYITRPENLVKYDSKRDLYYWYYATQVAHHMEGEYWRRWNRVMRQAVPEQQVKKGPEAGSWDPVLVRLPGQGNRWVTKRDQYEDQGGRLYTTCLSIYMLEVYYRHLPLYSKVYTVIQDL